eukprot:9480091-Pyramimonas_sp.AAC.1
MLDDCAKSDYFSRLRLEGKPLRRALNVLGVMRRCWQRVTVGLTSIAKGFIVHWQRGGMMVGLVHGIVVIDGKVFASAHRLQRLGPDTFAVAVAEELIVECVVICGALTHVRIGDTFKVLMP